MYLILVNLFDIINVSNSAGVDAGPRYLVRTKLTLD